MMNAADGRRRTAREAGPALGRRPGSDGGATRDAILRSARRRFSEHGYEHARVRDIAADAGVTAALVNRYFGGKEGLFARVLETAFVIPSLLPAERSRAGEVLGAYVADPDHPARRGRDYDPLLLILRSASSPTGARLLREKFDEESIGPIARWIGGPDAELRAALLVSCISGVGMVRKLLGSRAFAHAPEERLAAIFAGIIDVCVGNVNGDEAATE